MTMTKEQLIKIKEQIYPRYIGHNFIATSDNDEVQNIDPIKKGDIYKLTLFNIGMIPLQAGFDQDNWNIGLEKDNQFYVDNIGSLGFNLQLKSLSSITDEELRVIFELKNDSYKEKKGEYKFFRGSKFITIDCENLDNKEEHDNYVFDFDNINSLESQYLQLKGYALPQLVIIDEKPIILSVGLQVSFGIIELND